ncbi:hypothetical protein GGI25_003764 [Coemansia spiralis]|uniref:Uncharacterized protein n=2 Tax=Coemansia TaxID=4863 RepID=A0A9W8KXR9_9FUNG|nr:hypothetical protein EDC05_001564 [Coemansia umbellata]KAJ2675927.1 hypothetical protein GGI25_003764 [Coemansia spiralis]
MAAKSEEQILRSRLIVEDRPLRRCLRQLSAMCARYTQLSPEETQAACDRVLQEVRWFRHAVQVAVQSQRRCEQEMQSYAEQQNDLASGMSVAKEEIKRLNESLEESRNNKRHKIAYDEIAVEANKRLSREKLLADISNITSEIGQLRQEETAHELVLESLHTQYATVVNEMKRLETMSKSALSMQDLGIYLGDGGDTEGDGVGGEQGGHSSMGVSPTTPRQPGDPHGDFGTPIDDPMLDGAGDGQERIDRPPNGDEETEEGEDGSIGTEDEQYIGDTSIADSEEEGQCEDEEGELVV